ncbi:copper transpport protein [Coemansia sp. RSA 2610]|nr:copper transpport protein [Coemansia sp. RSA 2610]
MDMPDHGGHGGHGGHGDAPPMCAMNMALNWSTDNVCVLFDFWRVTSTLSLVLTCAAVFALGYGYELSRARVRAWELADAGLARADTPLVGGGRRRRWTRSVLYAALVGYSYALMLIFMTYNGFLMLAVVAGAAVGHYAFSTDAAGNVRGANCH